MIAAVDYQTRTAEQCALIVENELTNGYSLAESIERTANDLGCDSARVVALLKWSEQNA